VKTIKRWLRNEDEAVVLASRFLSFYKGTMVLKVPFLNTAGFSCGVVLLGYRVSSPDTVRHEYGHKVHLDRIGWKSYLKNVVRPSMKWFRSNPPYEAYYSKPYEYLADRFGGVERTYHGKPYPYSITPEEAHRYYLQTLGRDSSEIQ